MERKAGDEEQEPGGGESEEDGAGPAGEVGGGGVEPGFEAVGGEVFKAEAAKEADALAEACEGSQLLNGLLALAGCGCVGGVQEEVGQRSLAEAGAGGGEEAEEGVGAEDVEVALVEVVGLGEGLAGAAGLGLGAGDSAEGAGVEVKAAVGDGGGVAGAAFDDAGDDGGGDAGRDGVEGLIVVDDAPEEDEADGGDGEEDVGPLAAAVVGVGYGGGGLVAAGFVVFGEGAGHDVEDSLLWVWGLGGRMRGPSLRSRMTAKNKQRQRLADWASGVPHSCANTAHEWATRWLWCFEKPGAFPFGFALGDDDKRETSLRMAEFATAKENGRASRDTPPFAKARRMGHPAVRSPGMLGMTIQRGGRDRSCMLPRRSYRA